MSELEINELINEVSDLEELAEIDNLELSDLTNKFDIY